MISSTLSPTGHRIEVSDDATDGLERTVWQFHVSMGYSSEWRLRLYLYRQESRPTKRHKWRQVNGTVGYGRGYSDGYRRIVMKPEDVPLPPEVQAAALHEFIERVEVTT